MHATFRKPNREEGFTLAEIVITLALVTLLSSWAMPGLRSVLDRSRVTATSNHFLGLIETSRSLAMAKHRPVTLCASIDARRCNRDQGDYLLVFEDRNANGVLEQTEPVFVNEQLFRRGDFWLVWRDFRQTTYLRWAPEGRTDSLNGTFTLCNGRRNDRLLRQIVINRAGRARVVVPVLADGKTLAEARQRCAA
ncbi:MAG TPA: GspH/FimT family pseudopilin [Aquabacterium sp.]|nr:GspH/FimT family pseudopilin [Aquabacterium sp.]